MLNWNPPMLGFTACAANTVNVVWRDGTAVGILGNLSAESLARDKAEQERKDELRQQANVILLDDFR